MTHRVLNRRRVLQASGAMLLAAAAPPAFAASYPPIAAYRNPGCGCCEKWAAHLTANGFQVTMQDDPELAKRRAGAGVPAGIAGCHTAIMGDYIIEGHVPAADIIRFLGEKPEALGLAVPGMPVGSPGMEDGDAKEAYETLAFKADGTWSIYAAHA